LYKVLRTNDVYFGILHNITFTEEQCDHAPKYIYLQETLIYGHRHCGEQHEIQANGAVERQGFFSGSLDFLVNQ
jgi:hypothetical protein